MRPIDADALQTRFEESYKQLLEIYNGLKNRIYKQIYSGQIIAREEAISRIKDAPTIDAVPVVRCKDCKHYDSHGRLICTLHSLEESENCIGANIYMLPDDFCNYGERKGV